MGPSIYPRFIFGFRQDIQDYDIQELARALSLIIKDKFDNFEARDLSLVDMQLCLHVIQLGVARPYFKIKDSVVFL